MDAGRRAAHTHGMPDTASDRHAIQDVIVTYAAGVDDRDLASYRSCFMDDVELGGFGPEPVRGLDTWMAFVEKALEPYRATQHMLGVPKIEIDGDKAHMRTDVQASHFPADPAGKTMTLWATYETDLVRTKDGWRIQRHDLVTRATKLDAGPR